MDFTSVKESVKQTAGIKQRKQRSQNTHTGKEDNNLQNKENPVR